MKIAQKGIFTLIFLFSSMLFGMDDNKHEQSAQVLEFEQLPENIKHRIIFQYAASAHTVREISGRLKAVVCVNKALAILMQDALLRQTIAKLIIRTPGTIEQKKLAGLRLGALEHDWFKVYITTAERYLSIIENLKHMIAQIEAAHSG